MVDRLIDSNGSLVFVIRNYLKDETGKELFTKLMEETPWHDEIIYNGKLNKQPRKICLCGDSDFIYDHEDVKIKVDQWIPEIKELADKLEKELPKFNSLYHIPEELHFPTGIKLFNSCLLNLYRDGKDFFPLHSDLHLIGPNKAVINISLGASRFFYFKPKNNLSQMIGTALNNGDCLIMLGNTQDQYLHCMPRVESAEPRISITLRSFA